MIGKKKPVRSSHNIYSSHRHRPKTAPDVQVPLGINHASVGYRSFAAAVTLASMWLGISLCFAEPWADELGGMIGLWAAWAVIGGIALAPGFMNAFQIASLLLQPCKKYSEPQEYPSLTILVAAYNEASNILGTLQSLVAQRYAGKMTIIVIDDGSVDGTADVVRRSHPDILLLVQPRNTGKAAALNRGLAETYDELLVTVDADCWLQTDALRLLVREYLNGQPQTAAVAGAVFVHNQHSSWVTRLQYWDYFHGIAATKRTQAAYGGTLVAQGAFSLYRTEILREIGGWPACVGEDNFLGISLDHALTERLTVIGMPTYRRFTERMSRRSSPSRTCGIINRRALWRTDSPTGCGV